MTFKSKQIILLTGAGFTKDFGGFLGREMWSKIFNHPEVQKQPEVKKLLLEDRDFNFESVYSDIFNKFDSDRISAIQNAVESTYKDLDDSIQKNINSSPNINIQANFFRFIQEHIQGNPSEGGMLFSLNQDLFIERVWDSMMSGIKLNYFGKFQDLGLRPFNSHRHIITVPSTIDGFKEKLANASYSYIKLHGSYGWKLPKGNSLMVIGINKKEDLDQIPLLKWNLEVFKNALRDNKKLLIMGYGFKDSHINNILADAVNDHKLKVYILTPISPEKIRSILIKEFRPRGSNNWEWIWNKGLTGYFQFGVKDVFSIRNSHEYDELVRTISS